MIGVLDVPAAGAVDDLGEMGLIFPVPGEQKNTVLLEPRDGDSTQRITAKALDFKINSKTALSVKKVRIDLFLTDARFAIACSKYDKGGGWVGGATGMIVFNTVSKARAALRSRGKMLAGQVRYPWLQWVGSSPKKGWASEEVLVMQCADEDGDTLRLALTLPKNVEAARVAAEIADRAARYRLASEELDAEARTAIEAHVDSQSRLVLDGETKAYEFAAARPVGEHSARLAPEGELVAPALDLPVAPEPPPEPEPAAAELEATPPGPELEPTALKAFCTACGEGMDVADAFCSACGEKVTA
jgi:hypothetical protein